jgi:hypothetical protein
MRCASVGMTIKIMAKLSKKLSVRENEMRKVFLSVFILLCGVVASIQADDERNLVPITADNADQLQLLGVFELVIDGAADWELLSLGEDWNSLLFDKILAIIMPEDRDPDGAELYQTSILMRPHNFFSGYEVSPDGSRLAVIEREIMDYSDFLIQIRDVEDDTLVNTFRNWMFDFQGMTWSADNTRLAIALSRSTAGGSHERVLSVIDVESEHESAGYGQNYFDVGVSFHNDQAVSYQNVRMAWSSDSLLIAVVLADQLFIYSITDDETPLMSITIPDLADLKWGDEDRLLVGADVDGMIHVWGVVGE